jgi:hypothetical protein
MDRLTVSNYWYHRIYDVTGEVSHNRCRYKRVRLIIPIKIPQIRGTGGSKWAILIIRGPRYKSYVRSQTTAGKAALLYFCGNLYDCSVQILCTNSGQSELQIYGRVQSGRGVCHNVLYCTSHYALEVRRKR